MTIFTNIKEGGRENDQFSTPLGCLAVNGITLLGKFAERMEWEGMVGGRAAQLQPRRTQEGYYENQGQTVHRIDKGDR